jgi:hypothetical protein
LQPQLDELHALKQQAHQARLRDVTVDIDALAESGSRVEQTMMLKSQQQVVFAAALTTHSTSRLFSASVNCLLKSVASKKTSLFWPSGMLPSQ